MVGNGLTDFMTDSNAKVPFSHGMGLISDELCQVLYPWIFIMNFQWKKDIDLCILQLEP